MANLNYFPISYNVLPLFLTYYPYQTLWSTDMVNNYGVKKENMK